MIYGFVISILILILLTAAWITTHAFSQITQKKVKSYEQIFENMERTGVYSRSKFEALMKREVQVTSQDGLMLSGYVLENDPDAKRWMIIVHGYTDSLHVSAQFASMFEQQGFNVLLVDQRRHGKSEGEFTTYGYQEKYDIDTWVQWLVDHHGEDTIIGLHGQSLGGGTVLEYLSIAKKNVKFIIADCPYSDLTELIRYQLNVLNHLPSFPFLRLIDDRLARKAGFRLHQVSPISTVEQSSLPVLFIHGTKDRYVPTYMSEAMYTAKPEPKQLLLIEGAVHANAYSVDPQRYTKVVKQFIHDALVVPPETRASEDYSTGLSGITPDPL